MIILWYHYDLLYSLVQSVPEMLHIDWQECIFSSCSVQGFIYAQKIKLVNLLLKFLKILKFQSVCDHAFMCGLSCLTLCDPKDCSPAVSLSIGFPRQEYWSGLLFPSPGDWPNPGIQLCLLHFLHCRQILYLLSHRETFTFNEIHANWYCICQISSVQFSSAAQSCPTLCDPMNRSTPGLPVHHQLPESTQIVIINSVQLNLHIGTYVPGCNKLQVYYYSLYYLRLLCLKNHFVGC